MERRKLLPLRTLLTLDVGSIVSGGGRGGGGGGARAVAAVVGLANEACVLVPADVTARVVGGGFWRGRDGLEAVGGPFARVWVLCGPLGTRLDEDEEKEANEAKSEPDRLVRVEGRFFRSASAGFVAEKGVVKL